MLRIFCHICVKGLGLEMLEPTGKNGGKKSDESKIKRGIIRAIWRGRAASEQGNGDQVLDWDILLCLRDIKQEYKCPTIKNANHILFYVPRAPQYTELNEGQTSHAKKLTLRAL